MPAYETRHLVALVPMRHEGFELQPGDHFAASEIDARYFVSRKRARLDAPVAMLSLLAPAPEQPEVKPEQPEVNSTAAEPDPAPAPVRRTTRRAPARSNSMVMGMGTMNGDQATDQTEAE